jgi:hypothetical protein
MAQPVYQIEHQGQIIHCPYIHYGVFNGVPYEMGTAGIGNTKFAREIFASPHPVLNITGIDDKDLNIFVRDSLFNFMLQCTGQSPPIAGLGHVHPSIL